jgi:hypothetical protein
MSTKHVDDQKDPLTAIGRLRRIVGALAAGGLPEPVDTQWFIGAVADYSDRAARDGARLDQCLGLIPGPGGEPWWKIERRQQRDDLIRLLAYRFCDLPSALQRARWICTRLRRYETGRWRFDRQAADCPPAYRGTEAELLYAILRCELPAGLRTVRAALAGETGNETEDFPASATGYVENQTATGEQ